MNAAEPSLVMCKAKVLGARVTAADVKYWASLWVDGEVLAAAGVVDYEKVLVVNFSNGERFETYVRAAPTGSGAVRLAGGAARLGSPGDEIGFLVFAVVPATQAAGWKPKVVVLRGEENQVVSVTEGDPQ